MLDIISSIRHDIKTRYQNKGVKLFKEWQPTDDDLASLIADCVYYIQFQFHKITPEYEAGFSALTIALMGCGEEARRKINLEDDGSPGFQDTIGSLGAIIISALGTNNYIRVQRGGESKTSPYEIQALEKWLTLGEAVKQRVEKEYRHLVFNQPYAITTHKHPHNRKRVVKQSNPEQFDELLGSEHLIALDKLQQTPWEVNRDALDVVVNFKWDDDIPEIPKEGSKKLVDILYRRLKKDPSVQEDYNKASTEWEAKRKALKLRSNIMERYMTMTKGLSLVNRGIMYNIMEFDYRGRMYYCEPYFHYQGNDLMKGLLQFGEAKEVTERGLYWLKLQAAACYNRTFTREELSKLEWTSADYDAVLNEQGLEDLSLDKMALADRITWVDNNMSLIIETAKKKILHQKAEYPVIFYSTCNEIHKTLQAKKDKVPYFSKLPVAIDGSQNVLQHSSAINRDSQTGRKVGLVPTETPHDIYVAVGKRMAVELPEFFESRNLSMKEIRKNFSKRSTMVRNYSAGRKSIAENMYRDCVKNGIVESHNITPTDCFQLAGVALKAIDAEVPSNSVFRKYLQKLIVHEIGKHSYTYPSGKDAEKDWEKLFASYNTMNATARKKFDTISRKLESGNGSNQITWTTPTGFPVIQSICYSATMRIQPNIMGKRVNLQVKYDSPVPNLEKHKSAIAANFIHSQDASHAARVINAFTGNCFALVHDSYAVHASDVDELLRLTKSEFKDIYDVDSNYYQHIKDEIITNDEELNLELPELGDLTFEGLEDSDFFFS